MWPPLERHWSANGTAFAVPCNPFRDPSVHTSARLNYNKTCLTLCSFRTRERDCDCNPVGVSLTSDRLIARPVGRSSGTVDGLTGSTKLGLIARSEWTVCRSHPGSRRRTMRISPISMAFPHLRHSLSSHGIIREKDTRASTGRAHEI